MRSNLPDWVLCFCCVSCANGHDQSSRGRFPVIDITAKRFLLAPDKITLTKGETVKLRIHSEDVTHGFFLRPLKLDEEIRPVKPSKSTVTPQDGRNLHDDLRSLLRRQPRQHEYDDRGGVTDAVMNVPQIRRTCATRYCLRRCGRSSLLGCQVRTPGTLETRSCRARNRRLTSRRPFRPRTRWLPPPRTFKPARKFRVLLHGLSWT